MLAIVSDLRFLRKRIKMPIWIRGKLAQLLSTHLVAGVLGSQLVFHILIERGTPLSLSFTAYKMGRDENLCCD